MTTLVKTQKIYDEFIDFIAQGTTPEKDRCIVATPKTFKGDKFIIAIGCFR